MNSPSLSLDGQVALVTGARRGIGEACALTFAGAGADIAICDWVTSTGELDAVAAKIQKLGRRSLAMHADVKKGEDVARLVAGVMEKFGRIDILVNNAGVGDGGRSTEPEDFDLETSRARVAERIELMKESAAILHLDEQAWDAVFENNLKSCLLCSKAVAPVMIKQNKGNIINISSVRAFATGRGAMTNYAITKRGMVMLTEGLAADLARFKIRVNAIGPGGIETEMMRFAWADPERIQALAGIMPLSNNLIPPETCAHTALYLASDLAAYVTGQMINVDAGLMVSRPGI
ncbi:MAG TPA: SDR family oxidoreductase [Dehalococcoidia bacterium]|nr:SDR family oxidoreductase [Dehalococcoidia bacterium]